MPLYRFEKCGLARRAEAAEVRVPAGPSGFSARKTIEHYRTRLKDKLVLHDRSDWVDLALKSGLLLGE